MALNKTFVTAFTKRSRLLAVLETIEMQIAFELNELQLKEMVLQRDKHIAAIEEQNQIIANCLSEYDNNRTQARVKNLGIGVKQ